MDVICDSCGEKVFWRDSIDCQAEGCDHEYCPCCASTELSRCEICDKKVCGSCIRNIGGDYDVCEECLYDCVETKVLRARQNRNLIRLNRRAAKTGDPKDLKAYLEAMRNFL